MIWAEPTSNALSALLESRATPFERALADLRAVVGAPVVQNDEAARAHWSRSTLPRGMVPSAVVQPCCTKEVQEIVGIARRHLLPLYPLSGGKNWGYSDACAARDGQVILDLRRMNRILEINEELAYATIEPGVTQGQLAAYLEEYHPNLWMDATGAGPQTSIVGNTLERGFGHTVHGDRFLHACGMEVVLADGRLLRTGLGHYANAQAAAVYKWGVGPYLDGLFTQSNFGIVTKMTLWLIPRPEGFRAFLFSVRRPKDIGGLVETLRQLRLNGTLRTPVHIFNDLRVLAGLDRYPWDELDGTTTLSESHLTRLRRRHCIDAWQGTGALYGSNKEVAAAAAAVRRALCALPGVGEVLFLDDFRMYWAERLARLLGALGRGHRLRDRLEKIRLLYDLLRGKPSAACLDGTRWRVRPSMAAPCQSADPLDHNAGLIWLSPVLPATRAHVERVLALARPLFDSHGFEFQVTLSSVTARALCAVMTICYDHSNRAETRRAARCYDEVLDALLAAGYVPYRMGHQSLLKLAAGSDVFWDVAAQIKRALDPHGLLAPGHYDPLA
jgi:4-cresol dehydrogenase (hydroxylating)